MARTGLGKKAAVPAGCWRHTPVCDMLARASQGAGGGAEHR